MHKKVIITIILTSAILAACTSSRDKSIDRINSLESRIYSEKAVTFNKASSDSLLKMYEDFIVQFPSDSLAPVYLFRAANLTMTAGDGNKAISLLDQFILKYPGHPKAPVCLFFKAFVYENLLRNLPMARENYLLYIEKFPNGEFVKDANMSVRNLGKTPEQMIMEFEAMQKYDSVRKADSIANLKGKKANKTKG